MLQQEADAMLFVLCLWLSGVLVTAVDLLVALIKWTSALFDEWDGK